IDASPMSTCLTVTTQGPVARVTLNRPEVRNAFNEVLIAELAATFTALGQNPELRAIVLAAEGKAFCAGADLNWMKAM
ncbi:enoyl-CoA hydratase-related protein, partial [Yersinia pestis]